MSSAAGAIIATGVSVGLGALMGKSKAEEAEAAAQRKNMAIQLSGLSARRAMDLEISMLRDQVKRTSEEIERQSDQIQGSIRAAAAVGKGGNIGALQRQAEEVEARDLAALDIERRQRERSARIGLRAQTAQLAGMVQSPQAAGATAGLAGFKTGVGIGQLVSGLTGLSGIGSGADAAKPSIPSQIPAG